MSIIQDALKKAQSSSPPADLRPNVEKINDVRGLKPAIGQAARKSGKAPAPNRRPLITAALLIIITLIVSIFFGVQFLPKNDAKPDKASAISPPAKVDTVSSQQVSYRPIVKDAAAVSNAVSSDKISSTANPPDLVLSGIMYLEESPRALINNFMVEAGESVSGARVKEINRQNVILEYENTEITLSLK